MKIVVTGAAGFIGAALSRSLTDKGHHVLGIDNFEPYYDIQLKKDRLKQLNSVSAFQFAEGSVAHYEWLSQKIKDFGPDKICHLAAQAGVRHSIKDPFVYEQSNLSGFLNILETCRQQEIPHLVYASSSSVYGLNESMPLSEHHSTEHPASLYAATKKANEMMAHSYASMFGLASTGLRFFTVYGPWGRPDMSYSIFAKKILAGEPIQVFNEGKHQRDFTYIDDIIDGVCRVIEGKAPKANPDWNAEGPDPASSRLPYRVYNIGRDEPIELMKYIETFEKHLGKQAKKDFLPMQPGDVKATWADVSDLKRDFGYQPKTSIDAGVKSFVDWYRDYYQV